jgi:hypothetical protein
VCVPKVVETTRRWQAVDIYIYTHNRNHHHSIIIFLDTTLFFFFLLGRVHTHTPMTTTCTPRNTRNTTRNTPIYIYMDELGFSNIILMEHTYIHIYQPLGQSRSKKESRKDPTERRGNLPGSWLWLGGPLCVWIRRFLVQLLGVVVPKLGIITGCFSSSTTTTNLLLCVVGVHAIHRSGRCFHIYSQSLSSSL